MRRKYIMIGLVCVLTLTGCSSAGKGKNTETEGTVQETMNSETESSTTIIQRPSKVETEVESEVEPESEIESEVVIPEVVIPDEELTLMQAVLLNKKEFYGELPRSDEKDWHMMEEYLEDFDYDKDSQKYFYCIDMDHDGVDEICVPYRNDVMIFHESNGTIYGYCTSIRQFYPAYQDGTFEGSGAANIVMFYGNVSFENNDYEYEMITSYEVLIDDVSGDWIWHFYKTDEVSGEKVEITEDEYVLIMSNYSKPMATEYGLGTKNILKYVK